MMGGNVNTKFQKGPVGGGGMKERERERIKGGRRTSFWIISMINFLILI